MDPSKPLPTSLQNEFIPQEVLLSLTYAANAGPCPENLLPPKKIKTPKVCIYIYKVLGNIYLLVSSSLSIYLAYVIYSRLS